MAYKRKIRTSRKSNRRTRRRTTRKSIRKIARKVFDKNTETKCFTLLNIEDQVSTLTGGFHFQPLFSPRQGNDTDDRQGRVVNLTGCHIPINLHNNGLRVNYVRILVVQTKLQDVISGLTEMFIGQSNAAVKIQDAIGLQKIQFPINKWKYWPLYDRTFKLEGRQYRVQGPSGTLTAYGTKDSNRYAVVKKKLHKKVWFDETSPTVNTDEYGLGNQNYHYYLIAFGADAANDTNSGETIEISYFSKMFYKDA